jgi:uncharacterized NAD(P)/FAD-binding protein YdhS
MNKPAIDLAANVAIIGGGFTGAAVALHVARLAPHASILVFEPRAALGRGLAYDDADPSHRINVPAAKMSLIPGDETHFARWVAEHGAVDGDPDSDAGHDQIYPRRAVFGRYVSEHIAPLLASGRIRHVRERVTAVAREGDAWAITTDNGGTYRAAITVLATSHPKPEPPDALSAIASDPRLVTGPLHTEALECIPSDARVLIVGTGLTMADVVASLDRQGHRGRIVAISRRGLRSRGHPEIASEPYGSFVSDGPQTPSLLLQRIRRTVRAASDVHISWHAVLDAVRRDAPQLWANLSVAEQRRIVRHLRVFWDVHRFRIAPQVEAVLNRRVEDGTLSIVAASIRGAAALPEGLQFQLLRRRAARGEPLTVDHAIVCTGPAHGRILRSLPYLGDLSRQGWVVPDPLRLGIACDRASRALDNEGNPVPTLFIAGPLARATFGELMGVPEVAAHALRVAETVSELLTARKVSQLT